MKTAASQMTGVGQLANYRFVSRSGAFALLALVAGHVTTARAQDYPCIPAIYAPKSQKIADAGARNAALLAKDMAEEYRQTFTREKLLAIDQIYHEFNRRGDWKGVKRSIGDSKGKYSLEGTLTGGAWPAFHADFIAALAAELGALDYRTVTPTCSKKHYGSYEEYGTDAITTFFLWQDGTYGELTYSYSPFYNYGGDSGRKGLEKLIKARAKKSNGISISLELAALPVLPQTNTNGGLPEDKNLPRYGEVIRAYNDIFGMAPEEAEALNRTMASLRAEKYQRWLNCTPTDKLSLLRIPYIRLSCLGSVWKLENSKIVLPTQGELAPVQSAFRTWADNYNTARSTLVMMHAWTVAARGRALRAQWAADERREKARRRASGGDSILAGVAAGLDNAAYSMARDNERAAAAANDRYRAQYGCAPGQCSSSSAKASTSSASAARSTASSVPTRSAGNSASDRSEQASPREIKQMNFSESTIYRDGKPMRSDAEMCAKISVGDSHLLGPVVSKEPCSCEDRSMGRKLRVCEVRFSYSTAVIDPEAAKKGADAR